MPGADSLRVALLSYRSKPHCGGQGVYLRHLSRELVDLGHHVEVFSGQPYPELDRDAIMLHQGPEPGPVRDEDPFRTPKLSEYPRLDRRAGGRPHAHGRLPRAADLQPARPPRAAKRRGDFDVVHDNQMLGYGNCSASRGSACPLVTSIHHPISVDRRIEIEAAKGAQAAFGKRRWYGFVRMQARVAAAIGPDPDRLAGPPSRHRPRLQRRPEPTCDILPLGVDTEIFHPRGEPASPAASSRWPAPTRRSRASPRCCARSPSSPPSATCT